jgi:gamma-glutamylcyclotransferase
VSGNLYFAYGSNLSAARLCERAPSAVARGIARADGFALRLDKRGADGTAKVNLHVELGGAVWGVLYELDAVDWTGLDVHERDYARIEIAVSRGARSIAAQTYRSDHLTADRVAAAWYKDLIVAGARAHGLPRDWCALLDALPAR